jgi:hypothetical protein
MKKPLRERGAATQDGSALTQPVADEEPEVTHDRRVEPLGARLRAIYRAAGAGQPSQTIHSHPERRTWRVDFRVLQRFNSSVAPDYIEAMAARLEGYEQADINPGRAVPTDGWIVFAAALQT